MSENIEFFDFTEDDFPFKIEAFSVLTDELKWTREITGPGAVDIPGYGETGEFVWIRLTFPDEVIEERDEHPHLRS